MDTPIYQLKITLRHARPPIWRRLQVPEDFTLEMLHDIIQAVMPWQEAHLHHFQQNKTYYGIPEPGEDWIEYVDSRLTEIGEVLARPGDQLMYEYDFGDTWRHDVVLEEILEPEPGTIYPVCTAGAGAGPPEDSGGVGGYALMLEALADPKHPEHNTYLEWLGGEWDPEAFDLEEANARLQEAMILPAGTTMPVNRYAVVVRPKRPMIDWIIETADMTEEALAQPPHEYTTILIPARDDPELTQAYLKALKPALFEFELKLWWLDPADWPAPLTAELFDAWFDLEVNSLVYDAGWDEPFYDGDLGLEDE